MGTEPRLSTQTLKVLGELASHRSELLSGADIARRTKLASGTLYPILLRLEAAGWLSSQWEAGDPTVLGRPRRRFYTITTEGARNVRKVVKSFLPDTELLAWG